MIWKSRTKQEKWDQYDDLQIAENGRNDWDDHRRDFGGEKEIDKEKDRERDLDKKELRKSHMVNRFQRGMVEVLKRARSFLDGRGASLKRTQKRREAAVPKLWEDTHDTSGLDTPRVLYKKIPGLARNVASQKRMR